MRTRAVFYINLTENKSSFPSLSDTIVQKFRLTQTFFKYSMTNQKQIYDSLRDRDRSFQRRQNKSVEQFFWILPTYLDFPLLLYLTKSYKILVNISLRVLMCKISFFKHFVSFRLIFISVSAVDRYTFDLCTLVCSAKYE